MNKNIILITITLTSLFLACQPKPEPMVNPMKDMIKALADVHIAEGALLSIRPVLKDSIRKLYYKQIYEIHGMTPESFEHDIKILKLHPKLMEKVYEQVLGELNKREKDHGKKKEERKKEDAKKPEIKK